MLHSQTRQRGLVDRLYELGLCVSYDRVLNITAEIADKVCKQYENDGVVCPTQLKGGLFTTAGVDNIDHNPSSKLAKESFHGTAITLTQHPTKENQGEPRQCLQLNNEKVHTIPHLPEFYATVPPTVPTKSQLHVPSPDGVIILDKSELEPAKDTQLGWLKNVKRLADEDLGKEDYKFVINQLPQLVCCHYSLTMPTPLQ